MLGVGHKIQNILTKYDHYTLKVMKDKLKEVLKKEGITWEQYTEKAGYKSTGGFRNILFNHMEKLNKFLGVIGYECQIRKIEK